MKTILLATAGLAWAAMATAEVEPLPRPLQPLQQMGLEFLGSFEGPDQLKGYAARYQQQGVAVYLTPDRQHALVGTLYDAQGQDLSAEHLDRLVFAAMDQANWERLGGSTWIADGKPDAPRIVYVFSDPNCPFCSMFWKQARPWVDSGQVQLRHVMVGILREESAALAAAMLASGDPTAALLEHERDGKRSTLKPLKKIPADIAGQLAANLALMTELQVPATPAIFYRDDAGRLQNHRGAPPGKMLEAILGPQPRSGG